MTNSCVIVSEHAQLRISERMHINERSVVDRITNNVFAEICTRTISEHVMYQYVIMWDEVARRPYVIILARECTTTTIVTVVPLLAEKLRKHKVVVTECDVRAAKDLFKVYENTYHVEASLHITDYASKKKRDPTQKLQLGNISRTKWLLHGGDITSFVIAHCRRRTLDNIQLPQHCKAVLRLVCRGLDGISLNEVIHESTPQ